MNELNSILIEGSLLVDSTISHVEGKEIAWLDIRTIRYEKVGDELVQEEVRFSARVRKPSLVKACKDLKANSGVRVVGRLVQLPKSKQHFVEAEYVEFKHKPVPE